MIRTLQYYTSLGVMWLIGGTGALIDEAIVNAAVMGSIPSPRPFNTYLSLLPSALLPCLAVTQYRPLVQKKTPKKL